MTPARCQHAGLVEALSDGRLGAPERQSVERHVATCATCTAWLRDLDAIRQAIRAPVAAPTPLQHQRARLALLRGAVAEDEPRRPRHRRAWGVALVALVAGSAWASTVALRSAPLPAPPLATTGGATARPSEPSATTAPRGTPAATASTATDAQEPVAPAPAPTTAAPVAPPAPRPFGSSTSAASAAMIAAEPSAPGRRAPPAPAVEASSAAPAASAPAAPAPTPPSASHDFAEAMSALESGDFARAAARFEAFTGAHPFDPRSDEAAYLIAIALERAGRTAEARAAARRYLQSRPRGAHRAQAEKMIGAQAP